MGIKIDILNEKKVPLGFNNFKILIKVISAGAAIVIIRPLSSVGIATRYGLDGPGIESW